MKVKTGSSDADMTRADRETQVDESTSKGALMLSEEYKQVKQFAKNKLQQKNQRKLFRP